MKKKVIIIMGIAFAAGILISGIQLNLTAKDELLRFHVLANSDSPKDQELKRKVRDGVLEAIGPELKGIQSPGDAASVVLNNIGEVELAAQEIITGEGYHYPVKTEIGSFFFPTKSYGEFVLPAGEYQAVRVVIGEGRGENWWCVLFPPLCFVDISSGGNTHDGKSLEVITDENWNKRIPAKVEYRWKIAEVLSISRQKIARTFNF